jgi:broad specificity phosphatase PhoE
MRRVSEPLLLSTETTEPAGPAVATFFLVRHASHDVLSHMLCGRMPGVSLNSDGRKQAEQLCNRLSCERVDFVNSSPSARARETAGAISSGIGVPLEITPALDEIDFGEWTGRTFQEIHDDPNWQRWNTARSVAQTPGGETMLQVQQRAIGHVDRLRAAHPDARAVLVSHCDVLRAIVLHCLGMSLDHFDRIEISPASISRVVVEDWGAKVLVLNETVAP